MFGQPKTEKNKMDKTYPAPAFATLDAHYAEMMSRYSAARAWLRDCKKKTGKKSEDTKAARRTVRAIKKERAEFSKANPGFVPPKRAPKAKTKGLQYKEPEPKKDPAAGVTVAILKKDGWFEPDGKTPRNEGEFSNAVAPVKAEEAAPAPVAVQAVAKVSVTALLLKALAEGNSGSPSQLAAWVSTEEAKVTAKQAGDALARLAKTGKVVKGEDGKYAAARTE